jgi:predicted nucleotidyltransferase
VDQAVLFGSHARGRADEWSDVDLAVISPDFARMSHDKVMGAGKGDRLIFSWT